MLDACRCAPRMRLSKTSFYVPLAELVQLGMTRLARRPANCQEHLQPVEPAWHDFFMHDNKGAIARRWFGLSPEAVYTGRATSDRPPWPATATRDR